MKIDDKEAIAKLLKDRRIQLGFTQKQMAEAVGVSPITIMRLELGRLGYVHERVAKALEVPAKVVKRMVMVAAPADKDGRILPASTLSVAPNAEMRELSHKAPLELTTGDKTEIVPGAMVAYHKQQKKRRTAKLEGKKENVELHGKAHIASPLKKMFLWLASKS